MGSNIVEVCYVRSKDIAWYFSRKIYPYEHRVRAQRTFYINSEDFTGDILLQPKKFISIGGEWQEHLPVFVNSSGVDLRELPEIPDTVKDLEINYYSLTKDYINYHNVRYPHLRIPLSAKYMPKTLRIPSSSSTSKSLVVLVKAVIFRIGNSSNC